MTLEANKIHFTNMQVLEPYMSLGGVPYYLSLVRPGESPSQSVSRICFGNGPLAGEFDLLFDALFENAKHHKKIVQTLLGGLMRKLIIVCCRFPQTA